MKQGSRHNSLKEKRLSLALIESGECARVGTNLVWAIMRIHRAAWELQAMVYHI
jgi:hypothetical protein